MTEDVSTLFVTDEEGDVVIGNDGKATLNPDYLSAMYRVKDAGLEIIMRNQTETPDYFDLLSSDDILILQDLVSGFYMCDEPTVKEFGTHMMIDEIDSLVEWYNANGGEAFFHVNLLQSYGVVMTETATEYVDFEKYLDYYVQNVLVNVEGRKSLSTNFYPLATEGGNNYLKADYLSDLFLIANVAKELRDDGHDVFTSFCIQLFKDNGLSLRLIENVGDIRLQMYVAAALGATGFEYYPYCDIAGDGSGLLVDQSLVVYHEETKQYVTTVNKEIELLMDVLSDFSWQGAKFVSRGINEVSALYGELESFSWLSSFDCTKDAIVSEFKNGDKYAYMAVNYTEPTADDVENQVTFNFSNVNQALVIINGVEEIVDITDNSYTVTLGAGESVLIYALHK